jgi:uncharacterized protein YuzE
MGAPRKYMWASYDSEADVLYINFKKPARATDSELTDEDVIIRYENGEVIGLTVLHPSTRPGAQLRALGRKAGKRLATG